MIGPTNASPKNTVLTDNVQTISAVKTFTASPIVPDTPANTHSAVNQAYVESTVDGINNLVHKTGDEVVVGKKMLTVGVPILELTSGSSTASTWYKVGTIRNGSMTIISRLSGLPYNSTDFLYERRLVIIPNPNISTTAVKIVVLDESYSGYSKSQDFAIAYSSTDNAYYLYVKHIKLHDTMWVESYINSAQLKNGNQTITADVKIEEPTVNQQVVYYDSA